MKAPKFVVFGAISLSLLISLAACGMSDSPTMERPPEVAQGNHHESDQALARYVQAERDQVSKIMDMYPGLYSDISVESDRHESRGDRGIPAGNYSVVIFTYDYAEKMDWTATAAELDKQRPTIDQLCESTIFPSMRQFGVTGPLLVVYSYKDGRNGGPLWEYSCSKFPE